MLTLSYGFLKPQSPDKGSVFFPALESNITQLNSHSHNGIDSAPISTQNVTRSSQSILAANWVPTSGGRYNQTVTLPAGFLFSSTPMRFVITGGALDGQVIHPTLYKGSAANQYVLEINDNTQSLTALYG